MAAVNLPKIPDNLKPSQIYGYKWPHECISGWLKSFARWKGGKNLTEGAAQSLGHTILACQKYIEMLERIIIDEDYDAEEIELIKSRIRKRINEKS